MSLIGPNEQGSISTNSNDDRQIDPTPRLRPRLATNQPEKIRENGGAKQFESTQMDVPSKRHKCDDFVEPKNAPKGTNDSKIMSIMPQELDRKGLLKLQSFFKRIENDQSIINFFILQNVQRNKSDSIRWICH